MDQSPGFSRAIMRVGAICLCLGLSAGCGLVPKGQLDDCRRRSQNLQSENARLRDQTLTLRSQNDDLTGRAVADSRKLRLQEESLQRLEASVHAYQQERDQLASAFDRLKSQIQTTASPLSSRLRERLREFARGRPGCEFDEHEDVVSFATDELFEPGSDRLKPGAETLLRAFAEVVADPESRAVDLAVIGPAVDASIRRVGVEPDRPRGPGRAARVRDLLAAESSPGPDHVKLAGAEAVPAQAHRVRVHIQPRAEAR